MYSVCVYLCTQHADQPQRNWGIYINEYYFCKTSRHTFWIKRRGGRKDPVPLPYPHLIQTDYLLATDFIVHMIGNN